MLRCGNWGEGGPNVAAEDTLACRGITHYWSLGQNEDGSTTADLLCLTLKINLAFLYTDAFGRRPRWTVLVEDVDAWWRHIDSLALTRQFDVSPPAPPRVEPWGLTVAYLFDPSGVLWHFAQATPENPNSVPT